MIIFSQAYSVYDDEVGYCQGMSFLAAVLLLHVRVCCHSIFFPEDCQTGACFRIARATILSPVNGISVHLMET